MAVCARTGGTCMGGPGYPPFAPGASEFARPPNLWRRGEDGGPVAPLGPSYMDQSLFLIVPDPALLTNPNWHDFHRVDTVIDLPEGATVEDGSFELELPGLQVRHEVTVQDRQVVVRSEVRACGLRVGDPRLILATLADLPRRMALPVRG